MGILLWGFAIFGVYTFWSKIIKPLLLNRNIPIITNRGLLAVKAAIYLIMIEIGKTPNEANDQVKDYDIDMPAFLIEGAIDFINQRYGGRQLPMIVDTKLKGFVV